MNLQEHIRKVLIEETSLSPFIRRRIPHQQLEKDFKDSLDMASEMFFNAYKTNKEVMKPNRFTHLTISITMRKIHTELHDTMPEDSDWYVEIYNDLVDYYQDRIDSRYKQLQKLISNITE